VASVEAPLRLEIRKLIFVLKKSIVLSPGKFVPGSLIFASKAEKPAREEQISDYFSGSNTLAYHAKVLATKQIFLTLSTDD